MENQFNITEYPDKDIAEYLYSYHRGISRGVSNHRLAYKFHLDERRLRQIITKLIVEDLLPIGSCSTNHSGIYFISNEQDFLIAHRELISRIKKLAKRARALRKAYQNYKNELVNKQLQLI